MKQYFTTGQFAKHANVTERTIRYYDKKGLLKPSFVMDNGYRKYSEEDFFELQRIISLKQLGFTLDEIKVMKQDGNIASFKESLNLQIDLLNRKMKQTQLLKDALVRTQNFLKDNKEEINWNKVVELIQMSSQEEKVIENYRSSHNLSIRIQLHNKYSINKEGWFPWLFSFINFTKINRLLEVGCGSGQLWKSQQIDFRNREIFLSDISDGMIECARNELGESFNYMIIDAQKIPFKNNYFDAVVGNHMLFYLQNVEKGIEEIARVLRKGGIFYCSTYGKNHMKEITDLVKEFNKNITLSDQNLYERFGLDYGEKLLNKCFWEVKKELYKDELIVNDSKPLYDYIMSCHGNQLEFLNNHAEEFRKFINNKMSEQGFICITKESGTFICKK